MKEPLNPEENSNEVDYEEKKPCCIKELIPAKLFFFSQYAIQGIGLPYLNIFLVSIGLSVTQAGLINGVRTGVVVIFIPLIGMLADYTQRYKTITIIHCVLNAFIVTSVPFIASLSISSQKKLPSSNATSSLNVTQPDDKLLSQEHNTTLVVSLMGWFFLMILSGRPIVSFIDGAVVKLVKKYEKHTSYGLQRVFAPIGFSLGTFLAGVAVDNYTTNPFLTKYTAVFYTFAAFSVPRLIAACTINFPKVEKKIDLAQGQDSIGMTLLKRCRNLQMIAFLITATILGLSFSYINAFLFLLLEEMGTPKTIMGLSISISALSELLIFPISANVQKMVGGHFPCFVLALFSYALRFFLLSIIENYWLALPIQLLHSVGYALFWTAAVDYIHIETPGRILVTMLSVASTLYYNIGNLVSNVAGGVLYDKIGGRSSFQLLASMCGIWGIILTLFYLKYVRQKIPRDIDEEKELRQS